MRLAAITVTPEQEILLIYVCVRLVHSTNTVILKSLSGSAQVTLQQFNQRQETARLAAWAGRRFTAEVLHAARIILSTPVFFFFKWLLPRVILRTWQNYDFLHKRTGDLVADQDLMIIVILCCTS